MELPSESQEAQRAEIVRQVSEWRAQLLRIAAHREREFQDNVNADSSGT